MQPLCFVLMPFGIKTDGNKKEINFDLVYSNFIKPAIIKANLEPIRADAEKEGGFIHKPMYERLLFCKFAVADLSFDNANVFYELGIRHAVKPFTTVVIFEKNTKLAFDAAPLRAFPYEFTDGAVVNAEQQIDALSGLIKINLDAQKAQMDSPIGQLITNYKFPDLDYLQEDANCFADWVKSINTSKDQLNAEVKNWKQFGKDKNTAAQLQCIQNVKAIETAEGNNLKSSFDILYVLLRSYRSMGAFREIANMLEPVVKGVSQDNIYLQQQLAMAYYKSGRSEEAEQILLSIINKYGAEPETNGLLGSVYKGMMDANINDDLLQQEYLKKAIEAYLDGFEADPRYFYPGINALTLMFLGDVPDDRFNKFMPLVTYAVERLLSAKEKDYWVQATALELAVLDMNAAKAKGQLAASLFCNPDDWMKATTAGNLQKIYNKAILAKSSNDLAWLSDMIKRLSL
jgi:hypothetical protein